MRAPMTAWRRSPLRPWGSVRPSCIVTETQNDFGQMPKIRAPALEQAAAGGIFRFYYVCFATGDWQTAVPFDH